MPRNQAVAKQDTAKPRGKVQSVRSTRQFVEAAEQQVGQDRPRRMNSRGPARESLEPAHVEAVESPVSKDKLEMLAFMEEPVTVLVHESTNPTDEPFPEVFNDGRVQRFRRGQEMTVKRKFIEVLARAKKTVFSQSRVKDGNGDDTYIQIPHTALRYPFSVVHDANPRGKDWLKALLAQA